MPINYNNRIFRSVSNTDNGEVTSETSFHYRQEGEIVTAIYQGGSVLYGSLIAIQDEDGNLDMRYQHLNIDREFMTGVCVSRPELLSDGRVRLYETWRWTSGDLSSGHSIIEEVKQ